MFLHDQPNYLVIIWIPGYVMFALTRSAVQAFSAPMMKNVYVRAQGYDQ